MGFIEPTASRPAAKRGDRIRRRRPARRRRVTRDVRRRTMLLLALGRHWFGRAALCRRGHGDVETLGIDHPDDDVGGVQAGPTTLTVRSARTRRDQPTAPPPPGAAPAWR